MSQAPPDEQGLAALQTAQESQRISPHLKVVFHGVDFSGGRRHREKIFMSSLVEGLPAETRGGLCHAEILEHVAGSATDGRRHFWLIDATFGLPAELLALHGVETRWRASAEWLASFPSPRDWRRACRKKSRRELRRLTDRNAKTPFAPTNLRMFRQTWHCMVSLLLPLSDRPNVAILPFAAAPCPEADQRASSAWSRAPVWVGEGCPSSTLRQAARPHRGYKGVSEKNRGLRRHLLDLLVREDGITVTADSAALAADDEDGDALDSLLLLPAARRFALSDPAAVLASEPMAAVEGYVYR